MDATRRRAAPALGPLLVAALVAAASPVGAAKQTRGGWYRNPSAANRWSDDGEENWTLGRQSGRQAPGFLDQ